MTPGFGRGFFCGAPESLLGKAVAYTLSQWPELMRDLAEPARANSHEPIFYLPVDARTTANPGLTPGSRGPEKLSSVLLSVGCVGRRQTCHAIDASWIIIRGM